MQVSRAISLTSVILFTAISACKGPQDKSSAGKLEVPDQAMLAVQWQDGPRRENAEMEVQRGARDIALRLFPGSPMGAAGGSTPEPSAQNPGAPTAVPPTDPSWVDGAQKPAEVAELDFPRAWPMEVRRGETPALLAEWSRADVSAILAENAEALGNRRWLKTGDRIQIVMSPNQKSSFDRKRESFQRERIEAYFSRRYFEKIIVYRVKRGEYIAQAAKRLGDVPLWLIEEFNQTDFRGLQPGDEILIPVVATLEPGSEAPQGVLVVDEEGHPIASDRRELLNARLRGKFATEARMALDDSNVFMRNGQPGLPVAGVAAAAGSDFPRPMPAAHIGASPTPAAPAWAAAGGATAPVDQGPPMDPSGTTRREVVVKRGESLLHYVQWSQSSVTDIKQANSHLDPDRIFVGMRIAIPMSDEQFTRFVVARASWEAERNGGAAAQPAGNQGIQAARTVTYTVKKGDTGTAIARRHKVTVKAIIAANPGVKMSRLRAGQELEIPKK